MPRIKPEDKTPIEAISIRLRSDLIDKLHAYAKFLNDSSLNYIVSTVLNETIDNDKDFTKWFLENADSLSRELPKRGRPKTQLSAA